jgi:F-type H+-transporting ATPase subunit delta
MPAVASRYARAFVEVIFGGKADPRQAAAELLTMLELLHESQPLRQVWENPAVPAEQKRKLLDALVARVGVSLPVRNFLAVLIDHRRIAQLAEILRLFENEMNQRLAVAEAEVTSARVLGTHERQQLEQKIAGLTGKTVQARYVTDPTLLGGAVIRVGSTVYDGSVRGQLQKLKEQMTGVW